MKFDSFNDPWNASVSMRNGESLTGRFGISADYRNAWKDDNDKTTGTNIYAIANLYQEFMDPDKITVSGTRFNNANDKTWAGLGAGGTITWENSKYALYGEGSVNTSLNNFAKSYAVKGTVGMKVRW